MVKWSNATSIILMAASVLSLIISVHSSILLLYRNTVELNLNAMALGVFSTLNPAYVVGLVLIVASVLLARSRVIRGVALMLLITYVAGYTMLLSPYPSFYGDAVSYSYQSALVSNLKYFSAFSPLIYNSGFYPLAFTWEASFLDLIKVPALNISAAYGLLEPILLSLVSLAVAIRLRRLTNNGLNGIYVTVAVLSYTALIWSYQLHFCPQDFNIMMYMLTIPPVLVAINSGYVELLPLLGLMMVTLTIGHPTEGALLIASSASILALATRRFYRLLIKPSTASTIALSSALAWMSYNAYVFVINVPIVTYLITPQAIWRLLTLIVNPLRLINAWISMIAPNAYPLRYLVNLIDIYGGFTLELVEAVIIVGLFISMLIRGVNEAKATYVSIALGGIIVTIALTLVFLIEYSDRIPIYTAPVLGGLITYYLAKRAKHAYLLIAALILMSLLSLFIAGLILYWEYGYADPISYSFNTIIHEYPLNGVSCGNNNGLLYLTTYSMRQYNEALSALRSSQLVYYDGVDYCVLNR
ncbi:hypothetical protein [Caldivirga sp.]|uniref:hypothetical protein n=1 Tax=Caldivirga sp. TaxID=2080243 RepID=UPI003D11E4C0